MGRAAHGPLGLWRFRIRQNAVYDTGSQRHNKSSILGLPEIELHLTHFSYANTHLTSAVQPFQTRSRDRQSVVKLR